MNERRPNGAIILVCDRLNPAYLGPYGNTWVETPVLNELAAESLLFESCLADTTDLSRGCRSLWTGQHVAETQSSLTWIEPLKSKGWATTLITDDSLVCDHELAECFDQQIFYESDLPKRAATELGKTRSARLLGHAMQVADSLSQPFLLWVHAQAMGAAWDAPYALREMFADEEDPRPPRMVTPPSEVIEGQADPDHLLGLSQAYAAEVYALDHCLGPLLEWVRSSRDITFGLTSTRGFPLGEHGIVGDAAECMHHESLSVPWMMRYPQGDARIFRSQSVVHPKVVQLALNETLGLAEDVTANQTIDQLVVSQESPFVVSIGQQHHAVRTKDWTLQVPVQANDDEDAKLYAKPDDRWEANDVAGLCPAVVDELSSRLKLF
ncbi:MAG: sulfatase-like hydrolase/transferase, partial [Planctomycetota bacterium]